MPVIGCGRHASGSVIHAAKLDESHVPPFGNFRTAFGIRAGDGLAGRGIPPEGDALLERTRAGRDTWAQKRTAAAAGPGPPKGGHRERPDPI